MSPPGDPEAALVQFESHMQAKSAHQCPDAVFGNRFIKLFWHSKEQQAANPPAPVNSIEAADSSNGASDKDPITIEPRKSVKDRLAPRLDDEEERRDPITDRNLLKKSNLEKKTEPKPTVEEVQAPLVKTRS